MGIEGLFHQFMLMNKKVDAPSGLSWCFTDKKFTPWGGMLVFEKLLCQIGWPQALAKAPLPKPGSNRGIDPVQMVQGFLVTIWTGGGHFAHTALVRFDAALRSIFELEEVGCVSTFTRFFRRFGQKEIEEVFSGYLFPWFWGVVKPNTWTVDLDSTVLTRYGEQEGSQRGYNPRRRGKKSHHPLMAFAAECRMVINAWLRPGNTTDSSNVENFFRQTLTTLGPEHKIGLVRCDSGFCIGGFLNLLEEKKLNYIVVARMMGTIKRQLCGLKDWLEINPRMSVAEFMYQAQGWSQARRVVVVRHKVEDCEEGRRLIEVPGYTYSAYVTNLTLPCTAVRTLYQGRADSENRIKELLEDFAVSGFVSEKFWATEAAFRMACCAYNLMSLFRQALLGAASKHTLATLRVQCFAIGASLGSAAHKQVLRIGLSPPRRAWFKGLFAGAEGITTPLILASAKV